jgi:hypothetical protein
VLRYDTAENLLAVLDSAVIGPAIELEQKLLERKAADIRTRHVHQYLSSNRPVDGRSCWQPVVQRQLHSAGDASPRAALLLAQILPVFSVVAPCPRGASPATVPRWRCTTGC